MSKSLCAKTRQKTWEKLPGRCWYCGRELTYAGMYVEHQTPRRRGGGSRIENLVPACTLCNNRKGSRTVAEFRQDILDRFRRRASEYGQAIITPLPETVVFYGELPRHE